MQTILGSTGQIGHELAKELYNNYTRDIRLVSRHPKQIHESDELFSADLLKLDEVKAAISGSEIVYFTVGLPMDSGMWEEQFLTMIDNVIEACIEEKSKLVFFDNTYMYPKTEEPQTEETLFAPIGRKSVVRAQMANQVLSGIASGQLEGVICRAPEFYGPDKTQSITNTSLFNQIKENKTVRIPLNANALRTLIWTPDASRSMALIGNTPEAYGQTWHLPCDKPITYESLIQLIEEITGKKVNYHVIPMWQFKLGSVFNQNLKELQELLPRYRGDNIFVSDKFKQHFPDFKLTTLEEGVKQILY